MNSLVSVIVPMYNVENYVGHCIETIVNQTYRNLEIILVDDGSPDNSGRIADEWASKDSRIVVIHKPNGGLSDARNVAIDVAKGEYITLVDSDDYIHTRMIELLMQVAEEKSADVVVCSHKMVYEGKIQQDEEVSLGEVQIVDGKEIQKIYLHPSDKRLDYTVAWEKLYKRKCFETIRYPKGKLHEDEYTTFQILYEAEKIAYVDIPLYYYLSRESSIMGEFKPSRFDIFGGYARRIEYYESKGEHELAKETFFLGLHMMAQYKEWMGKSSGCEEKLSEAIQIWRRIIKKCRDNWKLSKVQSIEYLIFKLSFRCYCLLSSLVKRKVKKDV